MSIITSPGLAHSPETGDHGAATLARLERSRAGAAGLGCAARRPEARGKFLFVGGEKFYVRGVTYGPFGPDSSPSEYGPRATVERDFARITTAGFNAVRVYSVPPAWLLDSAAAHGLRLLVGLPWEQHVAFLDDARPARDIEQRVAAGVAACAGHSAVLGYAVGNEIPAPVVRWYGHRRVERFLRRLFDAAKQRDPAALVTYV